MQVTYHLTEAEFDQNVFESIKQAFKNRVLKISVVTVAEGTVSEVLEETHDYAVLVPYEELSKLADALDQDESFDLMGALEKFKVPAE